jgi:hypothetical protein
VLPATRIGLEACGAAHYWARVLLEKISRPRRAAAVAAAPLAVVATCSLAQLMPSGAVHPNTSPSLPRPYRDRIGLQPPKREPSPDFSKG